MNASSSEDQYLSDDSDFYGPASTKAAFLTRTSNFDPERWWKQDHQNLTALAANSISSRHGRDSATLYNPYDGVCSARQLDETVREFLARVPPATSQVKTSFPWILIANPYIPRPKATLKDEKPSMDEGPPEVESQWSQFCTLGRTLLDELTISKKITEKEMEGRDGQSITRAVNRERDRVLDRIIDYAKMLHCTSGKWMLFIPTDAVNAVWSVVANATSNNELGIAAKVAPFNPSSDPRVPRLICIYTKDFTNVEDVTRVVSKMRDLGLVDMKGRAIYYKCDAYTYLGINSSNEYNIKASMYSSANILKSKK